MSKQKIAALTAALLWCLLLVPPAPGPQAQVSVAAGMAGRILAGGTPAIDWYVIGGGGGVRDHSAPYALDGTIGQPVVGMATDTGFEICSGFWCGVAVRYSIYLPLAARDG